MCVCGRWGGLQRGEVQAFCLSPASHLGLLSVCVLLQPEPGKTYFQDLTLSCSLSVPLQLDPDKHIVEDKRESAKSNVEYLRSSAFILNEAQKCEKFTFGKSTQNNQEAEQRGISIIEKDLRSKIFSFVQTSCRRVTFHDFQRCVA